LVRCDAFGVRRAFGTREVRRDSGREKKPRRIDEKTQELSFVRTRTTTCRFRDPSSEEARERTCLAGAAQPCDALCSKQNVLAHPRHWNGRKSSWPHPASRRGGKTVSERNVRPRNLRSRRRKSVAVCVTRRRRTCMLAVLAESGELHADARRALRACPARVVVRAAPESQQRVARISFEKRFTPRSSTKRI
jgi:hypothetical protein